MNKNKKLHKQLRDFYILWGTQSLSQLGSSITAYALTLWLYDETGSSLDTAALRISTYAPYVLVSIFAGALADKFDKKKTMLICDLLAAISTVMVFVLYKTEMLCVWHLYLINAISGLMNTFQQPASEVAYTIITPKDCYQKTGVLQALSRSIITIGHPMIAAALYGLAVLDDTSDELYDMFADDVISRNNLTQADLDSFLAECNIENDSELDLENYSDFSGKYSHYRPYSSQENGRIQYCFQYTMYDVNDEGGKITVLGVDGDEEDESKIGIWYMTYMDDQTTCSFGEPAPSESR